MYKLFKTLTLFATLGILAFSCDPNGTEGEPPGYMDTGAGGIAIVDLDTINLVGMEEWRVFHPDSIKILNENFRDTGLRFKMFYTSDESLGFDSIPYCTSGGIPLPSGGNSMYASEHYQEWRYTFYFQYPNGDLDTLKVYYEREIRVDPDRGDFEYFYVVQKFNNMDMPELIYTPELPRHPLFLQGVFFKDVK